LTTIEEIKQKINDIDFFSPYIVVVFVLIYVALAALGYYYHIRNLDWADSITYYYILFGVIIFIFGLSFPKILGHIKKFTLNIDSTKEKSSWYSKIKLLVDERVLFSLVILAIILQGVNLVLLGGIPLLSGYLKFQATTDLWRVAYVIFLPALNLLLAKYPRKWYYILFAIGLVLFAVNGYRTSSMAIILSVVITTYYTMRLKAKYVLVLILLMAIIGIALGYIAVKAIQWQTWVLNPLELVYYRAGFTMMVLDKIAHMPGFTGGELFYQALTGGHPRVTVGYVVLPSFYQPGSGVTTSITSTIFGPAILDFGAWGLAVQMFILGLILRFMHSAQKIARGVFIGLYAIILAHTLIWIETGPTDSMVWFFYALGVISLLIFTWLYLKRN
jgi:oligosaccharide repeat unit polymerase